MTRLTGLLAAGIVLFTATFSIAETAQLPQDSRVRAAAMGLQPMTATIRVSSGALYDYIVIGERREATEGYDNAYDTVSPGNLNADLGEPFITAVVLHQEYKAAFRQLRGDIRPLSPRQQWQVVVTSSLPAGTPLKVDLQRERTTLPKDARLTLRDPKTKQEVDLAGTHYLLAAPGPGAKSEVTLNFTQP